MLCADVMKSFSFFFEILIIMMEGIFRLLSCENIFFGWIDLEIVEGVYE